MKNGVAKCLVGVVSVSSGAEAGEDGVLVRRAGRCVIGVCMIDVGQRQLSGDSSDDVANVQFHLFARRVDRLEPDHPQALERGRRGWRQKPCSGFFKFAFEIKLC